MSTGIPDTLLESELFGHMRGSFTDASRDKRGWLAQAQNGPILLDEVGETSQRRQVLLLRFLDEPFVAPGSRATGCAGWFGWGSTTDVANYKALVGLFNMPPEDDKRFLSFLRKPQCHLPFRFRTVSAELNRREPSQGRRRPDPSRASASGIPD